MTRTPSQTLRTALFTGITLLVLATSPLPHAAAATVSGLDLAGIDRSVRPGDDFFAYANGAWLKATQIPPDRSGLRRRSRSSPSSPASVPRS